MKTYEYKVSQDTNTNAITVVIKIEFIPVDKLDFIHDKDWSIIVNDVTALITNRMNYIN
jgi:hypothetical protein